MMQPRLTRAPSKLKPLHFSLMHSTRRRLWILIQFVQLINVLYLVWLSAIYLSYDVADTSVLRFIGAMFMPTTDHEYLRRSCVWFSIGYGALALGFFISSTQMVFYSIRAQRLIFVSELERHVQSGHGSLLKTKPLGCSQYPTSFRRRCTSSTALLFNTVRSSIVSLWITLGVRGEHFEVGMMLRETLEITLQTVQAHATSRTISNKSISIAYGVLIALSAIATPVLHRIFAHNPPMQRFSIVFMDFFLDFAWGTILPLWSILPYALLDRSLSLQDLLLMNGIGYYEKAQREVQQVIVLSLKSYILSVFPYIGALVSVLSIKKLLASAQYVTNKDAVAVRMPSTQSRLGSILSVPIAPLVSSIQVASKSRSHQAGVTDARNCTVCRLATRVHSLRVLYALGIFTLILYSSTRYANIVQYDSSNQIVPPTDCVFPLAPWFTTKPACVGWFFDCARLNISGFSTELAKELDAIHLDSLALIAFNNCPRLQIPEMTGAISSLLALIVYNSFVESWPIEAAVTASSFPVLQTIAMENVTLGPISEVGGLVAGAYPGTMERLLFILTDISALTQHITSEWEAVKSWSCSNCGLEELPDALFKCRELRVLMMVATRVHTIKLSGSYGERNTTKGSEDGRGDGSSRLWPFLEALIIGNNPWLTVVDDAFWYRITSSSMLNYVNIARTNISSIPDAALRRLERHDRTAFIDARGSALCSNSRLPTDVLAGFQCST